MVAFAAIQLRVGASGCANRQQPLAQRTADPPLRLMFSGPLASIANLTKLIERARQEQSLRQQAYKSGIFEQEEQYGECI